MQRPRALGLVSTLIALVTSPTAKAAGLFPIPPVPLRVLVADTDLILIAKVERIEKDQDGRFADKLGFEHRIAVLGVDTVLKGRADSGSSLRVPFPAYSGCPAPPRCPRLS